MKWVKRIAIGAVALVAALLLALYAARFRPGYAEISRSVDIAAAPEAIWPYVSSVEAARKWIKGLSEVRVLTPGVKGIGARDRMVMAIGDERTTLEMEVAAIDPPRRLELLEKPIDHLEMDFRARVVYTLEPLAAGLRGPTRVTLSSVTDYRTALGRMMEPIITRSASTMLKEQLGDLKRVVESGG